MREITILSAEDNPANRKIVRDLFERSGYRVIEALNGEEVISIAESEMPDIILMDIQLPRISGYEATAAIKADPRLKHILIIGVTSYALSSDEDRVLRAGCDDYLAKPYRPSVLLQMVRRHTQRKP